MQIAGSGPAKNRLRVITDKSVGCFAIMMDLTLIVSPKLTGCFLAELAVDHLLPPPAYYLTPMNVAWAVNITRRSVEDCKIRNIPTPILYEALDESLTRRDMLTDIALVTPADGSEM